MTTGSVAVGGEAEPAEPAEQVAAAVRSCPDVVDLHGGPLGGYGTYLKGRRVTGVRLEDGRVSVHVVGAWRGISGPSVTTIAEQVRSAVSAVAPGPVDVTVEDLRAPEEPSSQGGQQAALPAGTGRPGGAA